MIDRVVRTIGSGCDVGFGSWTPGYLAVSLPIFAVFCSAQKQKRMAKRSKATDHGASNLKQCNLSQLLIYHVTLSDLTLVFSYVRRAWRFFSSSIYPSKPTKEISFDYLLPCIRLYGCLCLHTVYTSGIRLLPCSFRGFSFTSGTVVALNLMFLTLQTAEQLPNAHFSLSSLSSFDRCCLEVTESKDAKTVRSAATGAQH